MTRIRRMITSSLVLRKWRGRAGLHLHGLRRSAVREGDGACDAGLVCEPAEAMRAAAGCRRRLAARARGAHRWRGIPSLPSIIFDQSILINLIVRIRSTTWGGRGWAQRPRRLSAASSRNGRRAARSMPRRTGKRREANQTPRKGLKHGKNCVAFFAARPARL